MIGQLMIIPPRTAEISDARSLLVEFGDAHQAPSAHLPEATTDLDWRLQTQEFRFEAHTCATFMARDGRTVNPATASSPASDVTDGEPACR